MIPQHFTDLTATIMKLFRRRNYYRNSPERISRLRLPLLFRGWMENLVYLSEPV